MKKSVLLLSCVCLFMFLTCSICEEPDNRPACEKDNYGSVRIINASSIPLVVDVTWGDIATNSEISLFSGNSVTYDFVPAGEVLVWEKPWGQQDGWSYDVIYTHACKTFEFTWSDKKSGTLKYLKPGEAK